MSRYFVPAVFVAAISGLAFALIVGVVMSSPETHANVHPEGYDRTPVGYVGEETAFEGFGLADRSLVADLDQSGRGRLLFVGSSCAACHGLTSRGGVVGPDLDIDELSLSEFRREIRSGPKGMPAYLAEMLSDEDIEALYAFLEETSREQASVAASGASRSP